MVSDSNLSSAPSIARKILLKFYPNVVTLLEYLCAIIPEFPVHLASANQQAEIALDDLKVLLASTLVGYYELGNNVSFVPSKPEMEQEEVLLMEYLLLL